MKHLALLALLIAPTLAFGAEYQMLEPLPFLEKTGPGGTATFADLIESFFTLALVVGAAITAVMLTVGGIQYMTSDALGVKQAGRDRIRNSLLGFLLLLSIYIILKTISPTLLNFDLRKIVDVGCQKDAQGKSVCDARTTPISGTEPRTPIGGHVIPPSAPSAGWYFVDQDGALKTYPPEQEQECQTALEKAGGMGACHVYRKQ